MGTRLIERGLNLAMDDPALWNLTQHEIVLEVHECDTAAGADALLTNTFGANPITLERLGHSRRWQACAVAGVRLARQAAGPNRWLLGDIGPEAANSETVLIELAELLVEENVDGLLLETMGSVAAERAVIWLRSRVSCPLIISLAGPQAEMSADHWCACLRHLLELGALSVGFNCGDLRQTFELLRGLAELSAPLFAKPAAGRPIGPKNSPDDFESLASLMFESGVRLLGGCCGTNQQHVMSLRGAADRWTAQG
jgi:methionine synthase I (cobalamin-dependent)